MLPNVTESTAMHGQVQTQSKEQQSQQVDLSFVLPIFERFHNNAVTIHAPQSEELSVINLLPLSTLLSPKEIITAHLNHAFVISHEDFQQAVKSMDVNSFDKITFLLETMNPLLENNQFQHALCVLSKLSDSLKDLLKDIQDTPEDLKDELRHIELALVKLWTPLKPAEIDEEIQFINHLNDITKLHSTFSFNDLAGRFINRHLINQDPHGAWTLFKQNNKVMCGDFGIKIKPILDHFLIKHHQSIDIANQTLIDFNQKIKDVISEYLAPEPITASIRNLGYWEGVQIWCQSLSPAQPTWTAIADQNKETDKETRPEFGFS